MIISLARNIDLNPFSNPLFFQSNNNSGSGGILKHFINSFAILCNFVDDQQIQDL